MMGHGIPIQLRKELLPAPLIDCEEREVFALQRTTKPAGFTENHFLIGLVVIMKIYLFPQFFLFEKVFRGGVGVEGGGVEPL